MKCAYHPDTEAAGVCVRCGRMLCRSCALVLANKAYCQPCADEVFTDKSPTGLAKNRSGILTAGGVLSIVGGAMGMLYSLMMLVPIIMIAGFGADDGGDGSTDDSWIVLLIFGPMMVVFTVLSVMAVVGGIYALKRRRFGLALGGSICGAVTSSVFGILAVVFIAMSRDEFEKKTPASQEAP